MKIPKFLSFLASSAVAMGIGFCLSSAPTFAAGVDEANGTATAHIPLTKVLQEDSKDVTMNTDMKFTLTADDKNPAHTPVISADNQNPSTTKPAPLSGKGSVTITHDQFNAAPYDATKKRRTVKIDDAFDITFDKIGQYSYVVKEDWVGTPQTGLVKDTNYYRITITVENRNPEKIDGKVTIAGATVSKIDKNGHEGKPQEPDNPDSPDNPDTPLKDRDGKGLDWNHIIFHNQLHSSDLNITKTVKGPLGDTNQKFTYTFHIAGTGITGNTYKMYRNGGETPVDVKDGSTFTLHSGEVVRIAGLPVGCNYSVEETQVKEYHGHDDYTASTGTVTKGTECAKDANVNIGTKTVEKGGSVEKHDFVNTKDSFVPTGIAENVLPFTLLAVLAVGAYAYYRKREKDHANTNNEQ